MFDKIKEWAKKQNEISMGYLEKAKEVNASRTEKLRAKADEYINTIQTAEGLKKGQAKACLMALTNAYPTYKVDYVGGHYSQPQGKENIKVMMIPQGIVLGCIDDIIPYDEIKNVAFKSEADIQKDVTLTRMIAFGVYALALKKKKKVVNHYLLLECEKGGMSYSMAFGGDKVGLLYTELFKLVAER